MSINPRAGAPVNFVNASEESVKTLRTKFGALAEAVQADTQPSLGPLTNLQGDWTGTGFNLIALPNNFKQNPTAKFRLMLNATIENTEFTPISAPIPDRGNTQDDIFFLGLTYLQKVSDANTLEGIHIEPGIFLFLPGNAVQVVPSVVRLSTIPHGDSVLAQGEFFTAEGGPHFAVADTTPFTLDSEGNRVNDTSAAYLEPFSNTPLPPGIPQGAIANPNIVLQQFNANLLAFGKKIVSTTVFQVNATPVGGIADVPPFRPVPGEDGAITNIPFIVKNANANSMSAIFWINTVQNQDGSQFLVVQYSQTVILDFPVPGPDGNLVDIKWPHISVASLLKR
jgi:hypothetical protein